MAANDANEQTDPQAAPAPDTEVETANAADSGQAIPGQLLEAQPPVVNVTIQQQDKNAEAAANMTAGRELAMDVAAQPGGSYVVNGQTVNCNGDPVGTSLDKSRT